MIVVDVDRPTGQHGIPPTLLFCEFSAVGFRLTQFVRKPELQGYYAPSSSQPAERPEPANIPCRLQGRARAVAQRRIMGRRIAMAFKGLKPIVYGGREVWPLVEGGKGVSASNHASSGAWAAAGGIGTVSAVNADSYDPEGKIVPQVYAAA